MSGRLTDEHWSFIDPHLPSSQASTGRPPRDRRQVFEAILWILQTGAQWRALPAEFGPWSTAYHHFRQWRITGVFVRLVQAVQAQAEQAGLDWSLFCIDGTNVRASRSAAGASKKA